MACFFAVRSPTLQGDSISLRRSAALRRDRPAYFEEIVVGRDATIRSVRAMTGVERVPQVFIAGDHIGGSDELAAYLAGRNQNAA